MKTIKENTKNELQATNEIVNTTIKGNTGKKKVF